MPETEEMDHFEHSMRAFLSAGDKVFQEPLMTYDCETIEDACIASLHFLITHKFHIRKCKNCGKYFVAYLRSDREYCDRRSPYNANRSCQEDGPKRTFEAAVEGDEVRKRLKQIETARRMRKSRNKGDWDIEKEFDAWQFAMNHKRKEYESGIISSEQFLTWLEDHKAYDEDWDYEENCI